MDGCHLPPPQMPCLNGMPELHGRGHMSHVDIMLAWALWWVGVCGLWLFPAEIGGKRPVVPHGFKSASRDPGRIASWWEGRYAGHNLAARTGAPWGPDVLDVDQREAGSGFTAYNRLKQAGLLAGAVMLVGTPSGGLHAHFAGTGQRSGRLPGHFLDFKSSSGCVLLPPSHVGGRPYTLIDQRPPTGRTFDWEGAKQLLSPPPLAQVRRPRSRSSPPTIAQVRGLGPRRGGRVGHLSTWLAEQAEGERNASLFWAACRAAEAGDQDVLAELVAAAVEAGLDEAEARRTAASAVRTVSDGR
jgi:bifunctional DNA primase/polymerase-like protein